MRPFLTSKRIFLGLTSLAIGFAPQTTVAEFPYEDYQAGNGQQLAWEMRSQMFAPAELPAASCNDYGQQGNYAPQWNPAMNGGPQPLTATPPAGTLGRTYFLPSREIPADKHPRIAIVDIIVPKATSVRLININPHREEDDVEGFQVEGNLNVWRFETNPLIPGVPHIYKAIFRFSKEPNAPETVRIIRLIPGRIVELVY